MSLRGFKAARARPPQSISSSTVYIINNVQNCLDPEMCVHLGKMWHEDAVRIQSRDCKLHYYTLLFLRKLIRQTNKPD